MADRKNEFIRDETRSLETGFDGDGCHNCCHNPKFVNMRKRVGKPKIEAEVFGKEMDTLADAYNEEVDEERHNVYWNHLAYTVLDEEEVKDAFYHCIDAYVEFPTISQILEMGMRLKMLQK